VRNIFNILEEIVWNAWSWKDSVKMYLKEIACEFVNWIHLAQDGNQWQNMAMNFPD
jgi:hypothetical protein